MLKLVDDLIILCLLRQLIEYFVSKYFMQLLGVCLGELGQFVLGLVEILLIQKKVYLLRRESCQIILDLVYKSDLFFKYVRHFKLQPLNQMAGCNRLMDCEQKPALYYRRPQQQIQFMKAGRDEISKINSLLKEQSQAINKLHIFEEQDSESVLTKPEKDSRDHSDIFNKIGSQAKFALKNTSPQVSRTAIKSGYIRRSIVVKSVIKNRHKHQRQLRSIAEIDANFAKQQLISKVSAITAASSPESIYQILHPLYDKYSISLTLPLIKQYSNCVYFGEAIRRQTEYEGFLIFYSEGKVYYGGMRDEKKNGQGVEIDLNRDIHYSGCFDNGRKKGSFRVVKKDEEYVGELKKGQYEGYGVLTTSTSIYKGQFRHGVRDGEGQQYFPMSKLTISGTFIKNKFTNHCNQISESRMGHKHSQLKNGKSNASDGLNPQLSEQLRFSKERAKISKEDVRKSYRQYNYDLFEEKYNEINNISSFRIKEPRRSEKLSPSPPTRKKSISEEQPLQRSKMRQI